MAEKDLAEDIIWSEHNKILEYGLIMFRIKATSIQLAKLILIRQIS